MKKDRVNNNIKQRQRQRQQPEKKKTIQYNTMQKDKIYVLPYMLEDERARGRDGRRAAKKTEKSECSGSGNEQRAARK